MRQISLHFLELKKLVSASFYLSSLVGALIFVVYFWHINYFPAVNLQSLLYLLISAAIVGLSIFIFITLGIGLAPYVWSQLLKQKDTGGVILFNNDATLVINSYQAGAIDIQLDQRKKIFIAYLISMFLGAGCWIGLFCAAYYFAWVEYVWQWLAVFAFFGKWLLFSEKERGYAKTKKALMFALLKITIATLLSSFLCVVLCLFLLNSFFKIQILVICVYIITLSSICLFPPTKEWKLFTWGYTVIIFGFSFLLVQFDGLPIFCTKIIRSLAFGDIKHTTITVDKHDCEIFKINGFNVNCNLSQTSFLIENIDILWRVGEMYIQDSKNKHLKIILSKTNYPIKKD